MIQQLWKSKTKPSVRGLTLLCLLLNLTACSTIEFVQYEQANKSPTVNKWHHSTLNGTVEISKPLNIESICGKKAWNSVTTEFTLLNAIPVFLMPTTPLLSFYSAWTNKVSCYQVTSGNHSKE